MGICWAKEWKEMNNSITGWIKAELIFMKQDLKRLIPLEITSFKDNYFTGTGVNWQGKAWIPGPLMRKMSK
jgi:hypothetical protein